MTGTATLDWMHAATVLERPVAGVKLLAPRQAREIAGLQDVEADRLLCDRAMEHLGFKKARLGRVEFYIRAPLEEKRHHERPVAGGNRAARRSRK